MAKTIVTAGRLSGNEATQNIAILSGSIAHELKNYLAAINICAELSEGRLRDIKKKVKEADYLIGNLYLQIQGIIAGKPSREGFRRYSITKNVEEALEQYPFNTGERELIALEGKDFNYKGNPALTNHVLYNLIKNALRAIANASRGVVTIKLESGVKFNKLSFKDTATGIAKEFLPKMFKLFASQSTAEGGTGVGLAFCKTIMQSYDGDIVCNSVEGEFTEFVLSFPK